MSWSSKLFHRFNILGEKDDFNLVHDNIQQDIYFRGTNLWVLIFAILIASVGLNVNSTAVIIGAMLISPLMGPIVGMGYALATYDFKLLKSALRNYVFAMLAGLAASALYFSLTPISQAQSELLSRTSPNIYDVMIALFGGFAGIIVIASKRKGNVVPGVAIATALMPPLCTAGYGLALGHWDFFFGALYLYAINSVFIGVATLVTTRFYRFPVASYLTEKSKRKANYFVSIIVICTALPSLFFGYRLVVNEKFKSKANEYIANETIIPNEFLLQKEVDAVEKTIKLTFGGKGISQKTKDLLIEARKKYDLDEAKVTIGQGFSIIDTEKEGTESDKLRGELTNTNQRFQSLLLDYDSLVVNQNLGTQLYRELGVWEPSITRCYANFARSIGADSTTKTALVLIAEARQNMESEEPNLVDPNKIKDWLASKYPNTQIFVEVTYK
jgi:uncharacterized hydrophobic protein (TIGR00271 family)